MHLFPLSFFDFLFKQLTTISLNVICFLFLMLCLMCSFHQIWKNFRHYFFNYSQLSILYPFFQVPWWDLLNITQHLFLSFHLFSLWFLFYSFCHYVFSFTNIFFFCNAQSAVSLILCIFFFISHVVIFISRTSVWITFNFLCLSLKCTCLGEYNRLHLNCCFSVLVCHFYHLYSFVSCMCWLELN
jgi:hypothetical protein